MAQLLLLQNETICDVVSAKCHRTFRTKSSVTVK